MKRLLALVATGLVFVTAAACSSDDTAASSATKEQTLTVFAAASLTDTFTEIAKQFEGANPGVAVQLNLAGSSDLVAQIQQGAPADVFASADTTNMDKATNDDLVSGSPANFATNVLEIVTPPDNPVGIDSLDDLTRSGVKVVLCAPEVPCGSASVGVEKAAGIDISPVSEEQSVTDVLNKVVSGEADAGLVYVTDVIGAGDKVKGIEFSESASVVNTYPIAALSGSKNADLAQSFAAFVTSSAGQMVLADAGFGTP